MIRLSFLGGTREVGRSATLIDNGTEKILLDYGIKINVKPTQYPKKACEKKDVLSPYSRQSILDLDGIKLELLRNDLDVSGKAE